MKLRLAAIVLAAAVGGASGCARSSAAKAPTASARQYGTLEGTVAYFEKMALPPGARLVVWAGEEGRLDDPKGRIAEREMPIEHQVPVHFDMSYALDLVDPAKRYSAVAEIRVEGKPWFVTGAPVRVLEGGIPHPVAIVVRRNQEGVPK